MPNDLHISAINKTGACANYSKGAVVEREPLGQVWACTFTRVSPWTGNDPDMTHFELWDDFHRKWNFKWRLVSTMDAAQVIYWDTLSSERFYQVTEHLQSQGNEEFVDKFSLFLLMKLFKLKVYLGNADIKAIILFTSSAVFSLRPGMLWESLWRKPLCTTGMTWTCRTWWITSRKRCSGQFRFA